MGLAGIEGKLVNRTRPGSRTSGLLHQFLLLFNRTASAQLITIAAAPILTRFYTPAEFGAWALYSALVFSLGSIAALRLDLALFTEHDEAAQLKLAGASVTAILATCMTVAVGTLLTAPFGVLPWPPWMLLAFIVNIGLYASFQLIQYRLNRRASFQMMGRMKIELAVATGAVQILSGAVGAGHVGLILGTLIGFAVPTLARLGGLSDALGQCRPSNLRKALRDNWRMPVFNGSAAVLDAIRFNGINVVIGASSGAFWLGMYSLAWRVVITPSRVLSDALGQVYLPRFADANGQVRRRRVIECAAIASATAALPFGILALFGPSLFALVFGEEWRVAGEVAQNLTPYLALAFITAPLSTVFIVVGRQVASLIFSFFYAATPLIILFVWRSDFLLATQIVGFAMGSLLAFYLLLIVAVSNRTMRSVGP